jgi:hypothetical protein
MKTAKSRVRARNNEYLSTLEKGPVCSTVWRPLLLSASIVNYSPPVIQETKEKQQKTALLYREISQF